MAQRVDRRRSALTLLRPMALIAPPLVFLGIFYFYPLGRIFALSLAAESGWAQWLSPSLGRVLWFTLWQAGLSTLLTLLAALPAAYVFARFDFRGKALILSLLTVPFVLPTVVAAAAFQALLGEGGALNALLMALFGLAEPPLRIEQRIVLLIAAHLFYNFAVVLRIVGGFWARLPRDLSDAARVLGAAGPRLWLHLTLPLLAPAVLAAGLLVFLFCFTSFGVVLILGGPRMATLEVEIYRQALHLFNLPLAAALSLLQLVATFGMLAIYSALERRAALGLMPEPLGSACRRPAGGLERWQVALGAWLPLALLGAPLAALVFSSLETGQGLGLAHYRGLFVNRSQSILHVPPLAAVGYSLSFALGATCIALGLGIAAAAFLASPRRRAALWLDPLLMLPIATSAVSLGFGFVVALDRPPLDLRGSIWLTVAAQALVALPFVIRALLPAWRAIPCSLRETAAVLGAGPWRVWRRVDWPILRRALGAGAVFAFAVSLGEFGATVLVARPQAPTLPLAIYRFLTHPGAENFGQAMAMAVVLMLVTGAAFLLVEKLQSLKGDF